MFEGVFACTGGYQNEYQWVFVCVFGCMFRCVFVCTGGCVSRCIGGRLYVSEYMVVVRMSVGTYGSECGYMQCISVCTHFLVKIARVCFKV